MLILSAYAAQPHSQTPGFLVLSSQIGSLRRFGRWPNSSESCGPNVTAELKRPRLVRGVRSTGLTEAKAHILLRAAG